MAAPAQICLARHGETDWNGWIDVPRSAILGFTHLWMEASATEIRSLA